MATGAATGTSLWTTFTAKAELIGAAVLRAPTQAAAVRLLREAGEDLVCTASVAHRFGEVAQVLPLRTQQSATEVVAAGVFAVAETGSVAVDETREDRGACFLSERLWILLAADQLVATLDEGMQRMRELVQAGSSHPLLMTGPSRTADIERVLTIGVHGPRAAVIVIVGLE